VSSEKRKAKSKSASLRPDQEAKLETLLADQKVKRSHYFQSLVDQDLVEGPKGTVVSRVISAQRNPLTETQIDRFVALLEKLDRKLGEK
jgi:hypothetical protein